MKRGIYRFMIGISLVIVAIYGIAWYVRPSEALDLKAEEWAVSGKIVEMVKNRKLEVQLSEQEVNQLIKKRLAQKADLPHGFRIKGAKFDLQGSLLAADLNLLWDYKLPIGAKLLFTLRWNDPNLEVVHVDTHIRNMEIGTDWFQLEPIRIPLGDSLPKHVAIRSVQFDGDWIRIGFKLK